MKRLLYILLSLCALGAAAWLSVDIAHTILERKTLERRTQKLPDLELTSLTGDRVYLTAPSRRGTVITYFTTTCPSCRDEIADFQANSRLFVDAAVILVSAEEVDGLRDYAVELGLDAAFVVATDEKHVAARHFGIRIVPTTLVYDASGGLVRRFDGFVGAATVTAALGPPQRDSGIASAVSLPESHSENSGTSNDQ